MFQGVAVDVEIAKKKTLELGQHEKKTDEHQPLSNILILVIMIAAASGICICIYHVALRVSHLEQRVEAMSRRRGSSAKLLTTSMPVVDLRRQTSGTSTTSSAPSTTSFPGTSSPTVHQDWSEDWEELSDDIDKGETYDNSKVGSGLQDDDEDAEEFSGEFSGDDSSRNSYDSPQSYKHIGNRYEFNYYYYDQFNTARRKRSAPEPPMSDAAVQTTTRRRRQHQHQNQQQQQQQQHSRRRIGYRTTSTGPDPADSSRQNPPRTSGDDRRRDRRRSGRRRHRSHVDEHGGQLAHLPRSLLRSEKKYSIFMYFHLIRSDPNGFGSIFSQSPFNTHLQRLNDPPFLGPNYKKILRLSYDVIITYDNRKSNLR